MDNLAAESVGKKGVFGFRKLLQFLVQSMRWNTFYYILSIIYGLIVSVDMQERALWNLEEMSICALGYPAIAYNNYGCWCGVGGSGKPMDGIDRCCMNHDFCYDEAVRKHECYDTAEEYVYPYRWACNNSHPVCLNNVNTACSNALCSCDRDVVECWSRFGKPKVRAHCVKMNTTKHHVRRPARHTSVFGKILNALEVAVLHPT